MERIIGPVSVQVKLCDGRIWRRHVDHVRRRQAPPAEMEQPTWEDGVSVSTPVPVPAVVRPDSSSAATRQEQSKSQAVAEPSVEAVETTSTSITEEHPATPTASGNEDSSAARNVPVAATPPVRRSLRTRQAPDYYGFGKKKDSKEGGV